VHRTRKRGFFSNDVVNVSITASAPQKGQLFRLSIVLALLFLPLPYFVRGYQFRVNPFQVVVVPIYPRAYILPRTEQPGNQLAIFQREICPDCFQCFLLRCIRYVSRQTISSARSCS
jgi:hypothetical protein